MECQANDSKKLFKVFDSTKRKRTRKKHEALDDTNSIASDDSNRCGINGRRVSSAKASFQNTSSRNLDQELSNKYSRERQSSLSIPDSPGETLRESRSSRRHKRNPREDVSLALRAGLVSTPRSLSPHQDNDTGIDSVPRDQDAFYYNLLEEALKRDKKKHRHSRRREERRSHERDESPAREHRHHRKHREEQTERETKSKKEEKTLMDQSVLENFAKLYAQIQSNPGVINRCQSNKSLQCEVVSKHGSNLDNRHEGVTSKNQSRSNISPSRIRSHDDCRSREQIRDKMSNVIDKRQLGYCDPYNNSRSRCASRPNMTPNAADYERYPDYPVKENPTKCNIDSYYRNPPVIDTNYRGYHDRRNGKPFDEDRKMYEQKVNRSYESRRDRYDSGGTCRRTARSDGMKDRNYCCGEYKDKGYEDRIYDPKDFRHKDYGPMHIQRSRNFDYDRASTVSRDDDFRDRDKFSVKDRDSGLSVADGDNSTVSGKSNYLRAVKQEITEQREAMDKMMKLWKELMRSFKGVQSNGETKSTTEAASNVRDSAAAQLQLWRECMRRYETVARDVGDTDARLMEEINKQRSEMAEMSTMWQECLQRYRDMSKDFNNLKEQLNSESPTRMPAAPLLPCIDGEGLPPATPYRLPTNYSAQMTGLGAPYMAGVQLRTHSSAPPPPATPAAPPPWWWAERVSSPRRRSSPDSRASRERPRHHKDRERDESRHKEKSKPSAARSEHRRRKR